MTAHDPDRLPGGYDVQQVAAAALAAVGALAREVEALKAQLEAK